MRWRGKKYTQIKCWAEEVFCPANRIYETLRHFIYISHQVCPDSKYLCLLKLGTDIKTNAKTQCPELWLKESS